MWWRHGSIWMNLLLDPREKKVKYSIYTHQVVPRALPREKDIVCFKSQYRKSKNKKEIAFL